MALLNCLGTVSRAAVTVGWCYRDLLEFVLLSLLVLAGFGCLAVELFRSELGGVCQYALRCGVAGVCGRGSVLAFRLKRAFSSPDMMGGVCR